MAGESCREEGEEERGGLVSKQVAVNGGRNQSLDSHRLLSQLVVESLQTLVGIVEFPPRLLFRKEGKGRLFTSFNRDEELLVCEVDSRGRWLRPDTSGSGPQRWSSAPRAHRGWASS